MHLQPSLNIKLLGFDFCVGAANYFFFWKGILSSSQGLLCRSPTCQLAHSAQFNLMDSGALHDSTCKQIHTYTYTLIYTWTHTDAHTDTRTHTHGQQATCINPDSSFAHRSKARVNSLLLKRNRQERLETVSLFRAILTVLASQAKLKYFSKGFDIFSEMHYFLPTHSLCTSLNCNMGMGMHMCMHHTHKQRVLLLRLAFLQRDISGRELLVDLRQNLTKRL